MDLQKIRKISISVIFTAFISGMFIINLMHPSPDILISERRVPAKLPEFNSDTVSSGEFMQGFDRWAGDTFAHRDTFRAINTRLVFNIFMQTDKEGLFNDTDAGLGRFEVISPDTIDTVAGRISDIAAFFDELDMNIYYSIIPDKSIYASRKYPGFDISAGEAVFSRKLTDMQYISITDSLDAGSYYKSDLHWDQSMLDDAVCTLLTAMDASVPDYAYRKTLGEFHGVYAGQYALSVMPDIMQYADIPGLTAYYIDAAMTGLHEGDVYDTAGFNGIDPYDFFLRGPQPVVVIENSNVQQGELYIFRDSFGSSIAPLLAQSYARVTLIDLRYIKMNMLENFCTFTPGSDVLFIYSSQILGAPDSIIR